MYEQLANAFWWYKCFYNITIPFIIIPVITIIGIMIFQYIYAAPNLNTAKIAIIICTIISIASITGHVINNYHWYQITTVQAAKILDKTDASPDRIITGAANSVINVLDILENSTKYVEDIIKEKQVEKKQRKILSTAGTEKK